MNHRLVTFSALDLFLQQLNREKCIVVNTEREAHIEASSNDSKFKVNFVVDEAPSLTEKNIDKFLEFTLQADDAVIEDSAQYLGQLYQQGFTLVIIPHEDNVIKG